MKTQFNRCDETQRRFCHFFRWSMLARQFFQETISGGFDDPDLAFAIGGGIAVKVGVFSLDLEVTKLK